MTLDPTVAVDEVAAQKAREAKAIQLDESQLSEAERKMVNDFAQKIDITDSNVVLQYGAAAQKNIASFSENTLNSVRTWGRSERRSPIWWCSSRALVRRKKRGLRASSRRNAMRWSP